MTPTTQKGFLVIADITGFTPFVASTELEHSQEILQQMLTGIIGFLTPAFTLAEVEGDAVFVFSTNPETRKGPEEKSTRAEKVLEIIESAYYAFRDRKASYRRIRTCGCKACLMASSLDLKFIVHYGDYIMNDVGGKIKPLGPCVNVVHRLLKNRVVESTGWSAYALLTKDFLDTIKIDRQRLYQETETYDHIGEIETYSINLDQQYKDLIERRKVYLSADEADYVIQKDFPVPPSALWDWSNDPKKRTVWSMESDWRIGLRPSGRRGKGSTNHCANSKVTEMVLDYKPFEYYTSVLGRGIVKFMLTVNYEVIPYGTRFSWHVKMNSVLPGAIRRFICRIILEKGMQVKKGFEKLFQLVKEEERL
ncbi:MAG TPA: DUF2652 domain-containing protein [Chryseolinea sp.]|nr:DUF2652 domain-containing protein [Chryseolinea sp.]